MGSPRKRQKEALKSTLVNLQTTIWEEKPNQTKQGWEATIREKCDLKPLNTTMCEGISQEGKEVVPTRECPIHMRQGSPELLE